MHLSVCSYKCSGYRVSRRWVALTLGRRSEMVSGAQRKQLCTLLSLSPEEEKSWAKPVHLGQSQRSAKETWHHIQHAFTKYTSPCVELCLIPVECGVHEEGDRCGRCRSLQSSFPAKEEKWFLFQRRWQQLQSIWGQWVSNFRNRSMFSPLL